MPLDFEGYSTEDEDENMKKQSFINCFTNNLFILTEGAIGQRIEREFYIVPDKDIMYAGLIYNSKGRKALETLYRQYLQIAQDYALPIMLMTNTRRANKERVERSIFYNRNIMYDYTKFLYDLSQEYSCETYIGGMMGCRGDAYSGTEGLSIDEALEFHAWQANAFKLTKIDYMFAGIMPSLPEAIGMARTMEQLEHPYIISLMIDRNGKILDGHSIHEAIYEIDNATKQKPLCYMTNCVHPEILREVLGQTINRTALVRERFCGIQANASNLNASELELSMELKTSSATELAQQFMQLYEEFPIKIFGGCCGTDNAHIKELAIQLKGTLMIKS
jgi:S-methylmethionine-dependent homocysteine/selenocysteine methylase